MKREHVLSSVGWGAAALVVGGGLEHYGCTHVFSSVGKLAAWCAAGLYIGLALVAPRRAVLGVAVGGVLAAAANTVWFAGAHGGNLWLQLLFAPTSVVAGVLLAAMTRRVCGNVPRLNRVRDVVATLLICGFMGGAANTLLTLLSSMAAYPGQTISRLAVYLWLGCMCCVVLPLSIVAARESLLQGLRRAAIEYLTNLGAIALMIATSIWAFRQSVADWRAVALPMLPFGIQLISALLIGPRTTAVVSMVMGMIIIGLTGEDSGPFAVILPRGSDHVIASNVFVVFASATTMLIASAMSERRRLAGEVACSRQRLEQAIVGSNIGIWDWDILTDRSRLEGGLPEILGEASYTEQPGFWRERLHPDDAERVTSRLQAHVKDGERYDVEYRLRTIDGSYRWFRSRGRAVRDSSGHAIRMLGTIADVTDRHNTSEALRQSEERYRVLVEGVRTIVWEVDVATLRFTFVSGAAEQILGYPISDWYTGSFWQDHLHPEDRDEAINFCLQKTKAGLEHTFEYRMIAVDGRVVWIQDLASVVMRDGRPVALRGVMVDITARKQAEQELERFFNLSPALLCVGKDGRFAKVNPAICAALGYTAEELQSRSYVDFVHPDDVDASRAEEKAIIGGLHTMRFENRYRHADGHYRWLSWSASPITADGMIYAAAQDITERKKSDADLAESERRFRNIAESIDQVFWITATSADGTKRVLYASPAFERVWGIPVERLYTDLRSWQDSIVDEDRPRTWAASSLVDSDDKSAFDVVYRIRRADGQVRRIHDRGRVVRDELSGELHQIGVAEDVTEAYEAEQALVRSESANAALIDAIPDLMFRVDREGRYLDYSGPADAQLMMPPERFIGRTANEVLPAERAVQCMKHLNAVFETGQSQLYEYESAGVSGDKRFWEVRIVRTAPTEALMLVRNITDRRGAEAALRQAEERYRSLVERLPLVVYTAPTGDAEPTYVSPQFRDITGIPAERLLGGRSLYQKHIHPDDRERVAHAMAHAERTGNSGVVEYRLIRPDGQEVWLREQVTTARSERGGPAVVHGLIMDITAAKRAEAALRDNQRRFALLVSQSPSAIIVWNTRFEITQWNPAAESIFGFTADEAIGRKADIIVPPTARAFVDNVWKQVVSRRGGSHAINENLTRHGKPIICEWRNEPLVGPDGSVVGVSSFVQDVTERVNADRRQALMMRELDHRVKNNMAAVLSLAEQTGRTAGTLAQFQATFSGRVRALARLHTALASSHWNGADLRETILQAVEPYSGEDPERLSLDGPRLVLPPRVAQSLTMAFNELATNAFKYGALSQSSGRVGVSWTVQGPEDHPHSVSIHWCERAGPPVVHPERRGFGMDLIDGAVTYQLRGSVEFAFLPSGFECRIVAPLIIDEATPDDPPLRQPLRFAENPL